MSEDVRTFVQSQYPGVETESEAATLLNDERIKAVCIATPAGDHARDVQLAIDAGKHVFVEKPLALSEKDARRLVANTDAAKLILMVGHTFLYNDSVHYVKDVIDSGDLGDLRYIYLQRLNLGIVRQDVNALWNLGPHDISLLSFWLGMAPDEVDARGFSFLQPEVEDVVFIYLRYPNGVGAHVHLSWLDPHKTRTATIVGSKKMLVYDDASTDSPVTIFDSGVDVEKRLTTAVNWDTFPEFQMIHRQGSVEVPEFPRKEPLANEMEAFLHSVETGIPPLTDGAHAIEVVRILEAADHSLRAQTRKQFIGRYPGRAGDRKVER